MPTYATHPAAEVFPMTEGSRLRDLVADIKENGLHHPIVLWRDPDGKEWILDGRNRIRACNELGIAPAVTWWDGDNPWAYVWSCNAERRDLDPGQRAAIRLLVLEGDKDWRKGRGIKPRGRPKKNAEEPPAGIKAREELAKDAKVSPRTAQKAITVQKEAPKDFEQVVAGKKALNQAYREITKKRILDKIAAEPQPLPEGPFRVLEADPPWPYEKRTEDPTHRGERPYPEMTIEEICALPVQSIAHDDSVLWLWITNAHLVEGAHVPVLEAWGFVGKTILTWRKNKMGTGDWLRGKTEHCILAVRGKPTVNLTNQSTDLPGDVREHSRKPETFYKLVERLCPGSKVSLFAQGKRAGWAAWGAETDKFPAKR